jgi:hypothetical protein
VLGCGALSIVCARDIADLEDDGRFNDFEMCRGTRAAQGIPRKSFPALYTSDEMDQAGPPAEEVSPKTTIGKTPLAREIFTKLQNEIAAQPTLDALYQWGANNENKARKATLPPDWQTQIGAIYQERAVDLKKPAPTIPNPQNDPPGFARWLNTRLGEFRDGHLLSVYVNDTVMPMIADMEPVDHEDMMAIITSHENRTAP